MPSKPTQCPDCGQMLSRHQRQTHSPDFCPAKGAPRLQPRQCQSVARVCTGVVLPSQMRPDKMYCSDKCNQEMAEWRKRYTLGGAKEPTIDEVVALRGEALVAEVERAGSRLLTGERSFAPWFQVLGVKEAA